MDTFTVSVTYGDSPYSNDSEGLTADQAGQGAGALLRDMLGLPGSAISRIVITREPEVS